MCVGAPDFPSVLVVNIDLTLKTWQGGDLVGNQRQSSSMPLVGRSTQSSQFRAQDQL